MRAVTQPAADSSARLLRMMYDFTVSRALHAACELKIADALPAGGLTLDELAAAVGLPPDSVRRLMRWAGRFLGAGRNRSATR